jgi:uncharacterized protein (TIGR02118 family)
MIRISVLYANEPGKKFDHGYYANSHMPLVKKRLASLGLIRLEVDKGVAGGAPDMPAPFISAGHLYFNSVAEFRSAMAAHGAELMGDVPNYTDIQPQMQISEIVG